MINSQKVFFNILSVILIIGSTTSIQTELRLLASHVETIKCFDQIRINPSSFINTCGVFFEKCNDQCIIKLDEFNTCADICRNQVEKVNSNFDWKCYDFCIKESNNADFVNLASCIFNPCRRKENEDFEWTVGIVIILLFLITMGFLFILYKHVRKQINLRKDNVREKIETYEKYTI
jgi:hypothetical protein